MLNSVLEILAYNPKKPLLFTQLFFWGFFLIAFLIYSLIFNRQKLKIFYLFLISLFFYYKTGGIFLILLLFTIISDYTWAHLIHNSKFILTKKIYLSISIILNLSLLCFFKYSYFFVESYANITGAQITYHNHFAELSNNFFGTTYMLDKLIVPIGVSFFTFQSLSYTFDVFREKVKPLHSIIDYGFFVCFFPHLVAGPIVKAHEFIWQIHRPYELTKKHFGLAVFWILNGFTKKIVADYLAVNFIDRVFSSPNYYSGLEIIFAVFGYSLQIYMDFSGYTDMAIGIALLFGFELKTNFKSPYKATSTSEFWKRWHISLSSWLQEYLYIPLGGNRTGSIGSYIAIAVIFLFIALLSGKLWLLILLSSIVGSLIIIALFVKPIRQYINTNINLMVTMLLGGLWHGSSWLFIIWGGLNGIGLIVHKLWQKISPFKNHLNYFTKFLLILITLTFISFTRIFFRSADMTIVLEIFNRIKNNFGLDLFFEVIAGYKIVFLIMLLGYIIHWIPENIKEKYRFYFAKLNYVTMLLITVAVVFSAYQLMSGDMQPFIYFQF
ncbi:MAG: MBOAT family protein [Bacteroidetes bacterium]|nr:MBOAT family protein [Bacteroidota bacterium]